MDATHPQHNPIVGRGWIKPGQDFTILSNTGRQRLNINGVMDIERLSAEIRFEDTVNAETTLDLLKQIEHAYPLAPNITIICDNARYYRARAVTDYLNHSRITLRFLPPYSPNLNLIERFWMLLKGKVRLLFRNLCRAEKCLLAIIRKPWRSCLAVAHPADREFRDCSSVKPKSEIWV